MISILKTVTDLDRLSELQRVAIDCYAQAVATAGQHAIEIDRAQAEEFREHLLALEKVLRTAETTNDLEKVAENYKTELSAYHEKARRLLERMRQEVAAAAEAMKAFAEGVATNGADHEEQVGLELKNLQSLTKSEDINKIRGGVKASVDGISSSVQQMRRSNQLVIAQLQDEIRLLHQQIQNSKRTPTPAAAQPPAPAPVPVPSPSIEQKGDPKREKLEGGVTNLIATDTAFCVLVVSVRNYRQLSAKHSQAVLGTALKVVLTRIQQLAGGDSITGQWNEGQFFAIVKKEASAVMTLSRDVTNKLSRDYAVQEHGVSQNVSLQLTAGIVDRRPGMDAAKFQKQFDQISGALSPG